MTSFACTVRNTSPKQTPNMPHVSKPPPSMLSLLTQPLYTGCRVNPLQSVVLLLSVYAKTPDMTEDAVSDFFRLLNTIMPAGSTKLPESFREATALVADVTSPKIVIDVCINDCILFNGKAAKLESCPQCGEARKDDKGKSRKSFHYMPLIPRIQRWFGTQAVAEALRAHEDSHDDNAFFRSRKWTELYSPEGPFAGDKRCLSLSICGGGFEPFCDTPDETGPYWMTPVVVRCMNLPTALRDTIGVMMLSALIPGKIAPKDMGTYLQPLVEELQKLDKGVTTYDVVTKRKFKLKARMIFSVFDNAPGEANYTTSAGDGSVTGASAGDGSVTEASAGDGSVTQGCESSALKLISAFFVLIFSFFCALPLYKSIGDFAISAYFSFFQLFSSLTGASACDGSVTGASAGDGSVTEACSRCPQEGTYVEDLSRTLYLDDKSFVPEDSPIPVDEQKPPAAAENTRKEPLRVGEKVDAGNMGKDALLGIPGYEDMGHPVDVARTLHEVAKQFHAIFTGRDLSAEVLKYEADVRSGNVEDYWLTTAQLREANRRVLQIQVPDDLGWTPKAMFRKSPDITCYEWKQISTHGILKFALRGLIGSAQQDAFFAYLNVLSKMYKPVLPADVDQIELELHESIAKIREHFPLIMQTLCLHEMQHVPADMKLYGGVQATCTTIPFDRFKTFLKGRVLYEGDPVEPRAVQSYIIHETKTLMELSGAMQSCADVAGAI